MSLEHVGGPKPKCTLKDLKIITPGRGKRGGLFTPPLSMYIPLPPHDDVKLTNLTLFYFILRELLFRIFNFESEGKVLVNFMDVQKIFP